MAGCARWLLAALIAALKACWLVEAFCCWVSFWPAGLLNCWFVGLLASGHNDLSHCWPLAFFAFLFAALVPSSVARLLGCSAARLFVCGFGIIGSAFLEGFWVS